MRHTMLAILLAFSVAVQAQTTTEHVVQRGETIESIANKYGITVKELKQANKSTTNFLYAGTKLVIPQKRSVSQTDAVQKEDINESYTPEVTPSTTPVTSEKKDVSAVWGFTYTASSFENVKESGHYGFLLETYDINDSGLGFGVIPASFNFGLVNKEVATGMVQFGPNYSLSLGKSLDSRLIIPAYVCCQYGCSDTFKSIMGKSTIWGWSINPKFQYKIFQIGLTISGGFESGSKVHAGFSAAMVF